VPICFFRATYRKNVEFKSGLQEGERKNDQRKTPIERGHFDPIPFFPAWGLGIMLDTLVIGAAPGGLWLGHLQG